MFSRVIRLNDLSDPRLAPYRSLRSRGDEQGLIAEGRWVVERLLRSGRPVHSLLVTEGSSLIDELDGLFVGEGASSAVHRDQSATMQVFTLPKQRISELVGYPFHRGVLAHGPVPDFLPLESFRSLTEGDRPLGLALLEITDPENLGSLLRTAAAMGVGDILIGPGTLTPFCRRVIRVSMASVFYQRFYRVEDPVDDLRRFSDRGIRSVATTLSPDATPLSELVEALPFGPTLLLMGNEAKGLPSAVQQAATARATLPMSGNVDSLNVAVSGAIFLYELSRQRQRDGSESNAFPESPSNRVAQQKHR